MSSGAQYASRRKLCGQNSARHTKDRRSSSFVLDSLENTWLKKRTHTQTHTHTRRGLRCRSNRANKIRYKERARALFDYPTRCTLPEAVDLLNSSTKAVVESRIMLSSLGRMLALNVLRRHRIPRIRELQRKCCRSWLCTTSFFFCRRHNRSGLGLAAPRIALKPSEGRCCER